MLIRERTSEKKLIGKLDGVSMGTLDKASFKALLRLQVFFTGRTHELILEYAAKAQVIVLKHADASGILDGLHGLRAQTDLLKTWDATWKTWQDEFQAARREAAQIPYGVLAVRHERLMVDSELLTEGASAALRSAQHEVTEGIDGGVFTPQIEILMQSAAEHLYGDGLNLSDRIWRTDQAARDGINNVIMQGIANGDSAWNVAKNLEQFLGAGADCPRWTSTRLYGSSAKDKAAGDTRGLLSGSACDGRGVSYNALRLARTEIQKIHSMATDRAMAAQPWVEAEKCNLSHSHPKTDKCDDVVHGGENGDGVYSVGTIEYPLHPNCFCFKTAVLMDKKDFTSQLKGWLNNSEAWPEMDQYAESLGVDLSSSLMNDHAVLSLAVWLFGDSLKDILQ